MKNKMDIEQLIQAIPGDNPVGEDLREDVSPASPYYQVKDLRYNVRNLERNSVEAGNDHEIKTQWKKIGELCVTILTNNSKDLEVAAWLVEAQLRTNELTGLVQSFTVVRLLCEQYWGKLYPAADEEDGLLTTVAPLVGLNGDQADGTLIIPIARLMITNGNEQDSIASWQYQSLLDAERIADIENREKRLLSLDISRDDFEQAVKNTSTEFFNQRFDELQQCIDEFDKLSNYLSQQLGHDAPPTSNIKQALLVVMQQIKSHIKKQEVKQVSSQVLQDSSKSDEDVENVNTLTNNIQTREDALNLLLSVADYFKQNEPHSPVSYTIERCVQWAKLPLAELLNELIPDQKARKSLADLTGIPEINREN